MVINTEWGAFGENGELDFVLTKWDQAVDEMSINPGKQIFEKMISGMYMGELIRQVLVDLMKDDLIFFEANREKILERGEKPQRLQKTLKLYQNYTQCRELFHSVRVRD